MKINAQRSVDKNNRLFQNIIIGLKDHDKRIEEHIYIYYWGYLIAVALRYLPDRNIAEEVVNDSFVKAFKNMYEFKHNNVVDEFQKSFRAWLAKITVRTALDRIRINKSPLSFVDTYDNLYVDHVEISDNLHVEDIIKLLNQLPDLHRMVFNMYEIEGFNHEEISNTLEIPQSSSRAYLSRAKQKLRELYLKTIEFADGNSR